MLFLDRKLHKTGIIFPTKRKWLNLNLIATFRSYNTIPINTHLMISKWKKASIKNVQIEMNYDLLLWFLFKIKFIQYG